MESEFAPLSEDARRATREKNAAPARRPEGPGIRYHMHVVVVGGGIAGLVASIDARALGLEVTLLESRPDTGGKVRTVTVDGRPIDRGPTVLTMRWVFEELFRETGAELSSVLETRPLEVLARHAWGDLRLDLYRDISRTRAAIAAAFGDRDANAYVEFAARTKRIYETALGPFLRSQRPSMAGMLAQAAKMGPWALHTIDAHRTLQKALESTFTDDRLVQLFGRYATYVGSSPFEAPATLNVIAHVEAAGVFRARGGIRSLVAALERLARRLGVRFEHGVEVERVLLAHGRVRAARARGGDEYPSDVLVFNGDASALGRGLLGPDVAQASPATAPAARSLSAVTFSQVGRLEGLPLVHHNVYFAQDYRAEFDAVFRDARVPSRPTVYVCAQDRGLDSAVPESGVERFLVLVNAPPTGDTPGRWGAEVREACARARDETLAGVGVSLAPEAETITTPREFERLFPGTGGALYGPRSRGSLSILSRVGAKTRVPGLYLAGGSVHPGAGMPMAALSGRLAAAQILEDHRA